MKRRLLLHGLLAFFFVNPFFHSEVWANSDTYLWGGAAGTNNWEDGGNWINLDDMNSTGQVPEADSDVLIDGEVTVIISSSVTTGSIQLSAGADLIIVSTGVLTTQEGGLDGSHGIRLDLLVGSTASGNYVGTATFSTVSASCTLTVEGRININVAPEVNLRAPKAGLYINESNAVTVESTGIVNIIVAGTDGIEVVGTLTNHGNITITDPTDSGIQIDSGGEITIGESGTMTISGGAECLNFRSNTAMTNNGTVELSGASTGTIVKAGSPWSFTNNKNFRGSGLVERANFFVHSPGSALMPGPSTSCLTFENGSNAVSLSGVTIYIQANGNTPCTGNDQVVFSGSDEIDITGANLNLTLETGYNLNEFITVIDAGAGTISGSFDSVSVNNTSYNIAYNSSDVSIYADGVTASRTVALDDKESWAIFPTLARDVVTIEWHKAPPADYTLEAYNLVGQKLYSNEAPGRSTTLRIPVDGWVPGMYWVLVRSRGIMTTRPFVKE